MRILKIFATCLITLAACFYVNAANPQPFWVFPVGASIQSSPAIGDDNTIYFGADNGMLYALSSDGKKKWEFVTSGPIVTTPAIAADGTIYVASVDRIVYAINPDGKERWRLMPGSGLVSSPAIAPDGTIYVGSVFNKFFAISADGFRKWDFPTTGNIISSPAVDAFGNVYFGCMDTNFYSVNTNGSVRWVFRLNNRMNSSPAIDEEGNIYFGGFDKTVYALDSNGKPLWQYNTEGAVRSSPIIGTDGTIYIGSDDDKLYAINRDGKKKWDFAAKDWVRSTPVISAVGTIYFGSYDNNFYAVNTNGNLVWKFKTAGYISSSAIIDTNGVVYFGSWDNNFYALKGDAPLANTPWPAFRKNIHRTGCMVSDVSHIAATKPKLPELRIKQPTTTPKIEEKPIIKSVEQKPVAVNSVKQPEPQSTATPQMENEVGEKPTIKITSPKNGSRLDEQTITVQGTARHRTGLKIVEYKLNSSPVHQAEGLGEWTAKIKLKEGENLFECRAISVTGAASDWEKLTINYLPLCQIYLQITGKGKVSPSVAGKKFESGQKIVLKAEPSSGFQFSGWEGSITETSQQITFVIASNMVLKANFIPEEQVEAAKPKKVEPETTAILNVTVQGNGKVTPYEGEHKLKAGNTYKLTSKPDSGFKFAGWSGGIESQQSEVTILLQTNTTIVAKFSPLLSNAGKYFGLIYEKDAVEYDTTGLIQINLLPDGKWKAKMSFIEESINCDGSFDNNGSSVISIKRGSKPPLALVLKMEDNQSVINGWLSGLDKKTLFTAKPQLKDVKTKVGSYTLIMVSPTNTQSELGDGYARLNVDNSGVCQIEGKLGNGVSFFSSIPIVVGSTAPVFIPIRKDVLAGWLIFTNSEMQDIAGELHWFKSDKLGLEKFNLRPIGSSYEKQGKGEKIINSSNLVIALSGGGLDSIVGSIVQVEPEIRTTFSEVDLKFSFDTNNGFFKGTFLHPITKKTIKYEGAILQKTKWGSGHFIVENKIGLVFVAPDITQK